MELEWDLWFLALGHKMSYSLSVCLSVCQFVFVSVSVSHTHRITQSSITTNSEVKFPAAKYSEVSWPAKYDCWRKHVALLVLLKLVVCGCTPFLIFYNSSLIHIFTGSPILQKVFNGPGRLYKGNPECRCHFYALPVAVAGLGFSPQALLDLQLNYFLGVRCTAITCRPASCFRIPDQALQ